MPSSATGEGGNWAGSWQFGTTRSSSTASSTARPSSSRPYPPVLTAEQALELDAAKRQRTLIRIDAGAGSVADINWLLFRGYHVLAKDYSTKRATRLAAQVTDWFTDPRDSQRQVGLVPVPADDYHAASTDGPSRGPRCAAGCPMTTGA